jgi:hypothetical protein
MHSPSSGGGLTLFLPLTIICLVGIVVIVGTVYARRHGYMKSKAAVYGVCLVIALLAAIAWFGPMLPGPPG